jgi:hypothetical protein
MYSVETGIRFAAGPLAREVPMQLKEELSAERQRWKPLTFYQKFEQAVILVLTALIAIVAGVVSGTWC